MIPGSELVAMQAENERWMPNQATWMQYGDATDDGHSGRVESWTHIVDPGTGFATVPCRLAKGEPLEAKDLGGEMLVVGRGHAAYLLTLPMRITSKYRDQFILDDGHTYEVTAVVDPPSFQTAKHYGVERIR